MLSIANVGGSKDAGHYYEKADDYYTQGKSPSEWHGEGAKALNLEGEVKADDFRNLLDGILPNGEFIKVVGTGRRGGTDLTLSAPKSISMQALIGKDLRLIEAHDRAVARTLQYAEGLVRYREMIDGETNKILSKNFVAATFRHELSRACDPQLHTHCVVLNLTQREDGKWRAMDNELFYRQKMLMGAFYRAELAREVQDLGYEIRITHSDGRFELSHISDSQLDEFSQRSQAIEEVLQEHGKTRETASPQELQILTIATRPKKTEIDRKILREYWEEKSLTAEISYQTPLEPQRKYSAGAMEIVRFAVDHTMERQSVVTEIQLLREALQHGVGKTTYQGIKQEIERRVKGNLFIQTGDRFTTRESLEREKEILRIENEGRKAVRAVLKKDEVKIQLRDRRLNQGQRKAATLILTSNDRVVGVQGLAGTGKTFMLQTVRELAEEKGFQMIGLAPSAAATNELSKTGIKSQTIAYFQTTQDKQFSSKTILVVDEAGMVSSKQMEFILKTAENHRSKVLLIGDTQQLKAVEAGRPFAQLQAHGMATAGMNEIQRQKNQKLKRAVELAAKGEVKQSITLLQKSILEINHPEERYAQMAKDYISLSKEEREKTLIVSGTNEARKAINQKVREGLKLEGKGHEIETLERKDLTKAQIKQTRNYAIGNTIQAERNYSSLNLKKGELCKVHSIRDFYIILQKPDGSSIQWKPHQKNKVTVYQSYKKEISPGELVRIKQNDRQNDLTNGDRAKVVGVDENKIVHLQGEDGKSFKLDGSKPLHIDYGYCSTVHSAQGRTCERVLIEADTKSFTSARDNYYVAISRARHEAKIYTNDREKLPEVMSRDHVKETALEINRKELGGKEMQNLSQNMNRMTQIQPKNLGKEWELDR